MGTLADSLFNVLMSWVRALVNSIWALFTTDHTTLLEFLGKNWIVIAAVILAAGLVIDWLVWLVRWQPYHLWARRVRRFLHLPSPEEEEKGKKKAKPQQTVSDKEEEWDEQEEEDKWLPLEQPQVSKAQEQEVMRQAESVPDAELGAYPGMRYGTKAAPRENMESTHRYSAVHNEGVGAAEVARRKAEIEAWQLQMQEEARQKAEAERAARAEEQRRIAAQKAYEEEQRRIAAQKAYEEEQRRAAAQKAYEEEQRRAAAQKAYEEEQRRAAAQKAYEEEQRRIAAQKAQAEQARLAQEEYQRKLAEYQRQKAQYERDMERYRQEKAAYDAQMARQKQQNAEETPHRRRAPQKPRTYSDYVAGETVENLPDPPKWPQVQQAADQTRKPAEKPVKQKKTGGLMGKMAKLIEEDDENELTSIKTLPPRVDVHDAYRPAKKPQKSGKRNP